ncbi:ADP-ribosylglycohydrolase family protein, partial [Micromonospora sp. CPCC 205371]|nr:ADP-ribosylglycohydrolase family protein [Micromonospora sp. CPCC 205371]
MRLLLDKSVGCLVGAAVGDALGGATETALPEEIRNRYGGWVEGIVPPFHENWATNRPLAPYHKGDGHITDDTLMTHALVRAYAKKRDHLDAYDVVELLVPDLIEREVYIPDLERQAGAFHRLAAAGRRLVPPPHPAPAPPRRA